MSRMRGDEIVAWWIYALVGFGCFILGMAVTNNKQVNRHYRCPKCGKVFTEEESI